LQEQLDSLRGQIEAMQEASEFRFSRRDEAAERLRHRVADLENELRYLKDDLYRVRSSVGNVERSISYLERGW